MRRAHYTERTAKGETRRNGEEMGTVPQAWDWEQPLKAVSCSSTTAPM